MREERKKRISQQTVVEIAAAIRARYKLGVSKDTKKAVIAAYLHLFPAFHGKTREWLLRDAAQRLRIKVTSKQRRLPLVLIDGSLCGQSAQ